MILLFYFSRGKQILMGTKSVHSKSISTLGFSGNCFKKCLNFCKRSRFLSVERSIFEKWTFLKCFSLLNLTTTTRERPAVKKLKNRKRTSKCQSILFYSTRKTQTLDRIKTPKIEGGHFEKIFPLNTKSHNAKKLKGGHFSLAWYCM